MKNCPSCKISLEGELIYNYFLRETGDEKEALRIAEMYGATKTTGRWKKEIGHYSMKEDRTTHYECPSCGALWSAYGKNLK